MVRIKEIIEASERDKVILKFRGCNLYLTKSFNKFKSKLKLYDILGGNHNSTSINNTLYGFYKNVNNAIVEIANFQDKNYDAELETIAQSYFDLKDEIDNALNQVKLGLFDWINKN